jgi:hypothetical protein
MKEQSFLSKVFRNRTRHEDVSSKESVNKTSNFEDVIQSQNKMVMNYLTMGTTLTQIEAAELFGIWRLGARIWDLRRAGHDIKTFTVTAGNKRFAQYKLNMSKN